MNKLDISPKILKEFMKLSIDKERDINEYLESLILKELKKQNRINYRKSLITE